MTADWSWAKEVLPVCGRSREATHVRTTWFKHDVWHAYPQQTHLWNEQVTRGHNIVADGWAGASNPQPYPKSCQPHTNTHRKYPKRLFFCILTRSLPTDQRTDGRTKPSQLYYTAGWQRQLHQNLMLLSHDLNSLRQSVNLCFYPSFLRQNLVLTKFLSWVLEMKAKIKYWLNFKPKCWKWMKKLDHD